MRALRSRASNLAAATFVVTALSGCYPTALLQSPRTVGAGKSELAVGLPALDIAFRGGVAEDWDVGARVRLLAAEVNVKHELLRGSTDLALEAAGVTARDGWALDFDNERAEPHETTTVKAGRLTLLAGWLSDEPFSMWLAPGLHAGVRQGSYDTLETGESVEYAEPFVAPSLNAGVRLRAGSVVSFFAEGGALVPVAGDAYGRGTDEGDGSYESLRLGPADARVGGTLGVIFSFR